MRTKYAFPLGSDSYADESGMTLRDYFAGQCLVAIAQSGMDSAASATDIAANAYHVADAMLEARKETP